MPWKMEKINHQKVRLVWVELKIFANSIIFLEAAAGWPYKVALAASIHGIGKNQFPSPPLTPNKTFQQESHF